MSRIRLLFIVIVTSNLLAVTTNAAFAILILLPSASNVPFSRDYPEHARKQVRAAFETENCGFIGGRSTMRVSTLHFAGNTTAINDQLQKLASCPAATVSVSFEQIDHKCDWRIVHSVKDNMFRVVVNLESNQIELEELRIPPAKGPDLKR